ncbi:polysaccharide deacetylase family protein [Amycolatopsis coloradensis]|uniref:Polysaccharide deacetylase family protein n=1 Tax=Amycolatopsis coloradensis TaxID=76021 RepID=A0ACD5BPH0_9PSEU
MTLLVLSTTLVVTSPAASSGTTHLYPAAPSAEPGRRTLVLYDADGEYGWLGESYAVMAGNLLSHGGAWVMRPVQRHFRNELQDYTAVVYIGTSDHRPLPSAFLDAVLKTRTPVLWIGGNIGQLYSRDRDFSRKFGWRPAGVDTSATARVIYRGASFDRDRAAASSGIMRSEINDPAHAAPVGEAVRPNGSRFPWGVRSRHLTYLGEVPFSFTGLNDRYLAAADLLSRHAGPSKAEGKKALIRIEDVGPDADPAQLRAIADYLHARRVPFSVAVYPRYRDPRGRYNNGEPVDKTLADTPAVVAALRYMTARRGTLVMHGYTHQYGEGSNPYSGVSGEDYEFYRVRLGDDGGLRYQGPVAADSRAWARQRIASAAREFRRAGLAVPTIFEFPHYVGSAIDYTVVNELFPARYDQGFHAAGWCPNGACGSGKPEYSRATSQRFPFLVRDIYGSVVIPESLDHVSPASSGESRRLPEDILATAKRIAAVRGGVASFFYHPYLGTSYLKQVVTGIQDLGFAFTDAAEIQCG